MARSSRNVASGELMKVRSKGSPQEIKPRKCYECGGEMIGSRTYYQFSECGLDSVTLENVVVYRCQKCGAVVPEIPAIAELHRVIALNVIYKNTILTGQEIRFLRKMAGFSGKELSKALGANPSSLSRWERGSRKISKRTDAALRLICLAGMMQDALKERSLVPAVAAAAQRLAQVDIMAILTRVKDILTKPVSMSIDPEMPMPVIAGTGSTQEALVH